MDEKNKAWLQHQAELHSSLSKRAGKQLRGKRDPTLAAKRAQQKMAPSSSLGSPGTSIRSPRPARTAAVVQYAEEEDEQPMPGRPDIGQPLFVPTPMDASSQAGSSIQFPPYSLNNAEPLMLPLPSGLPQMNLTAPQAHTQPQSQVLATTSSVYATSEVGLDTLGVETNDAQPAGAPRRGRPVGSRGRGRGRPRGRGRGAISNRGGATQAASTSRVKQNYSINDAMPQIPSSSTTGQDTSGSGDGSLSTVSSPKDRTAAWAAIRHPPGYATWADRASSLPPDASSPPLDPTWPQSRPYANEVRFHGGSSTGFMHGAAYDMQVLTAQNTSAGLSGLHLLGDSSAAFSRYITDSRGRLALPRMHERRSLTPDSAGMQAPSMSMSHSQGSAWASLSLPEELNRQRSLSLPVEVNEMLDEKQRAASEPAATLKLHQAQQILLAAHHMQYSMTANPTAPPVHIHRLPASAHEAAFDFPPTQDTHPDSGPNSISPEDWKNALQKDASGRTIAFGAAPITSAAFAVRVRQPTDPVYHLENAQNTVQT